MDDDNSVSNGSEFALGTTSSSTEHSDKSSRSGDLLRQNSRLPLPLVPSTIPGTRSTCISARTRGKHARYLLFSTLC
ncbi:hypothetical protein GQ600_9387 [Phytophthora cactorum]|nr:hypothetical protein GQ600_9387 [Phytophthora cactorum]